jgi:hypothetical protein
MGENINKSLGTTLIDPEGSGQEVYNSGAVDRTQADVIVNGGDFGDLRTNNALRDDQWERIDEIVLEEQQDTLQIIGDINDAGLDRDVDLGAMFASYERASGVGDAHVSMSGEAADEKSRQEFDKVQVPVPFIHQGFSMNARAIRSSEEGSGDALPESAIRAATFEVSRKLEDLVINGSNRQLNGETIDGLTNHPDRNTVSGSDWSASNDNIFTDLNNGMEKQEDAEYDAPWYLYVYPGGISDLRTQSSNTDERVIDIVRQFNELEAVRRTPLLDAGEAVLVKLSQRVVDLAVAADINAIEAESKFGRTVDLQVAGVMAPRVKSDKSGNSGVTHFTGIDGS